MSNSVWDFIFNFAADASGIESGFETAQQAADNLEVELNIVDQAAQATQEALAGVADEVAAVVMQSAGLSPAVVATNIQAGELNRKLSVTERIGGRVSGQFRSWGAELAGMVTGALAISALIGSVAEVSRFSLEMGTLAQRSGLAVETFGALTQEARNLGGEFTESEMFSALERLQTETNDVYGTLQRFQDLARGMSSNEAIQLGDSLGIDAVLVNVLQQTDQSLASLTDRYVTLGGLTEEQLGQLRLTNTAWNQIQQSWQSAIRLVLITLAPALNTVAQGLAAIVGWASQNSDAVSAFFVAAAAVITAVYLPAITAALGATLALIAPFIPLAIAIGAIGTAVALLYDDFQTFERGGRSVIGRMVEQWPALGENIEAIRGIINSVSDSLFTLEELVQTLVRDGMAGAFDLLGDSIANVFQSIGDGYPTVAPLFDFLATLANLIFDTIGVFSGLFLNLGVAVVRFIFEALAAVIELFTDPQAAVASLKSAFGRLFDSFLEIIPTVKDAFREVRDVAMGIINSILSKFEQVGNFIAWIKGESPEEQSAREASLGVIDGPGGDNELVLPDGQIMRTVRHTIEGGSYETATTGGSVPNTAQGTPPSSFENSVPYNVPSTVPDVVVTMERIEQAAAATNTTINEANAVANDTSKTITENNFNQSTMNNQRTSTVTIDKIEVVTQATDAKGMRDDIRSEIERVFSDIEADTRTGIQ